VIPSDNVYLRPYGPKYRLYTDTNALVPRNENNCSVLRRLKGELQHINPFRLLLALNII
jgi:hypothetical protein